jgi:hypothetical protein
MADVWVLLLIVAFFGVCVALVKGCDVIMSGDDADLGAATERSDVDVDEREPVGVGR